MRLALIVVIVAGTAATAAAYPQWQFSTGASRCGECHVAPGGGGLLTDYGRGEAADTVSGRGDGALLHGAWTPPAWLNLGGDLRGAFGGKQLDGEAVTGLAFPMQADLAAQIAVGPVSINVTVGANGAARGHPTAAPVTNYLVSRQHYLGFRRGDAPWSIRAGRFFPTLGVRTQDHTAYPRRHLDMYLLEEPYAVEGWYTRGSWEGFVAAFVGNPIAETRAGAPASGASAYVERLMGDGAIAGQARVAIGAADRRFLLGAVGKRWLAGPRVMLIGELDVQRQTLTATGFDRYQLIGYLSATRMFLPGYQLGLTAQRFAPDVSFRGTTRNALQLDGQVFPWAHVELHGLLRAEATGGDTLHPGWLALAQLHYFL